MQMTPEFSGPYKELLVDLATVIEELRETHGTSFVNAGDDKVFAVGGDGTMVVFDESLWNGLVEVITPSGGISIKPDEAGIPSVDPGEMDEQAVRAVLKRAAAELRSYFENRYWSVPVS